LREREREREMTSFLGDFTPTAIAMGRYVSYELFIFLRRPKASLNLLLVTARMVTHFFFHRDQLIGSLLIILILGFPIVCLLSMNEYACKISGEMAVQELGLFLSPFKRKT
jgi:hypothetical protein